MSVIHGCTVHIPIMGHKNLPDMADIVRGGAKFRVICKLKEEALIYELRQIIWTGSP